MQTRPLHLCSISCSLLTRTRMLREKNSNINYTDVKPRALLKHPLFPRSRDVWDWTCPCRWRNRPTESLHAYDWLFTAREIQTQPPMSQVLSPFPPLSRRRRESLRWWLQIDPFKVNAAILSGVQNYWGERKMYSECMEKVGRLMPNNLRKFGILQFLWITK